MITSLAIRELDYVDSYWAEALALKRVGPVERVCHVLEPMLRRAESAGLLFANLRGAMFTWGEENQATFRCGIQDYVLMISECLTHPEPAESVVGNERVWIVSESLYYQTLDLSARPWYVVDTWDERRAALIALPASG